LGDGQARSLLDAAGAKTKKGTVLLWRDNTLDQHHRFPAGRTSQRRPTVQNGMSFNLYLNISWTGVGPITTQKVKEHTDTKVLVAARTRDGDPVTVTDEVSL
jgi:hypothetical protein